jgi:SAM-dependent methyltransferase
MAPSFEALIEEATAAPIEGWDFGWLDGRASEERPPWGYARLVAGAAASVSSLLDLQTGGGEVLAGLPRLPSLTVATECWEPNVVPASRRLRERGAWVAAAREDELPFADATFELVISRHPVTTSWNEVARVLAPGGRYLSQQIGPRSMAEITEFFMGSQSATPARTPEVAVAAAASAGLRVDDVQSARLRATFHDIGAVVYFLRLVVWTVPDFDVERYRERLQALHRRIEEEGAFVAHSTRFLIEATKPA